jgi:hypothetical protein
MRSLHQIWQRHIALPTDHGSWVFLFSPLLIGLFAGQQWGPATFFLVLGAVSAFLIRQPITVAVKVYSNRRGQADLPAAWFWTIIYAILGLVAVVGLAWLGFSYLFVLAFPGLPVFAWHLWLVSRRAERRQAGVEIVATGVLALAAPAAYWVGVAELDPRGWWLALLVWLQSAASIVYAYLRLAQRELRASPNLSERFRMATRALLYTTFNVLLSLSLSVFELLPNWIVLPFLLQWLETIYGSLIRPAIRYKPTTIGIRQLIVSTLFTILFILAWFQA